LAKIGTPSRISLPECKNNGILLAATKNQEATRTLVAAVMVHFLDERQNGEKANYFNDFLYEPAHISSPLASIVFKTIKH